MLIARPLDSWTATPAFELIVRLIARNFARTAVGPGLSRNKAWLSVAVAYPENVFKTVILMRVIPAWLKPLASWFIPYTWSVSRNLREALRLLVPMINERRRLEAAEGPAYEKPNDLLQWMMEEAWCERDARAEKLVHRLLVLAMASVHTTSMACAQAFFDLCEHPEYVEPLREEILEAVRATGGWKKTTLTRMRKMDSFMRESQRLNPPSLSEYCSANPIFLYSGIQYTGYTNTEADILS